MKSPGRWRFALEYCRTRVRKTRKICHYPGRSLEEAEGRDGLAGMARAGSGKVAGGLNEYQAKEWSLVGRAMGYQGLAG